MEEVNLQKGDPARVPWLPTLYGRWERGAGPSVRESGWVTTDPRQEVPLI